MKEILKLLRVKHYIKNLLVFLPLIFGGAFFDVDKLKNAVIGFLCFCMVSSAIYIFNDYRDIEKDRMHPVKKNRPLASGSISPGMAGGILTLCLVIALVLSACLGSFPGAICLALYIALNVAYSMGLKNRPVIDIVILASGFVIRVFYGGFITDIEISKWLYLVVSVGSLYMGLGKRRNELKRQTDTREVLKYYNESFLDKNMYVCLAMADVFYALWALEISATRIIWTVPVFIIMLMCYSLDVERSMDEDPVEVILKDKILLLIIAAYAVCVFVLIYGGS